MKSRRMLAISGNFYRIRRNRHHQRVGNVSKHLLCLLNHAYPTSYEKEQPNERKKDIHDYISFKRATMGHIRTSERCFGVATSKHFASNVSEYVKSTTSFGSICMSTRTFMLQFLHTTYSLVSSIIRKAKVA